MWNRDRIPSLSLCGLSSSALGLRLAATAVSLLQPCHSSLADLRIAGVECLKIIRVHDSRELDLRGLVLCDLSILGGLRVGRIGVSIRSSDED